MQPLEAQQRALLHALLTPGAPLPAECGLGETLKTGATKAILKYQNGLICYKSNARALAERCLAATYPVVTALLSTESMAQLARALWHTHPPQRGDMAQWGTALAGFLSTSAQLADLPWLADVARLEWALHQADGAADVEGDLPTLARLTEEDPGQLTLRLAPGLQLLHSAFAVVPVVLAHRLPTEQARATALAQLDAPWCPPSAEHTLVWRVGHGSAQLQTATETEADFVAALQAGQSLLAALEKSELDFSLWLPKAVRHGLVQGVDSLTPQAAQKTSTTPPSTETSP